MSDDVVIRVEGLWKRYGLPLMPALRRVSRRLRGMQAGVEADGPWALRDVHFEVKQGETLGIIGRNGAGKSTLLKVLAGVTPPTHGKVDVRGRVFPMIELNAGLHPDLTGRENVRLLGAIMGLTRREIDIKMPEIEDFCELDTWFDQPVRKYSSGMVVRLGFAVAMNVDADILLVDEVLAVGDVGFQNRCLERIKEQRSSGKTVLLVSHALEVVQYLCDRVIVMDSGNLTHTGEPESSITKYENMQYRAVANHRERQYLRSGGFYSEDFSLLDIRVLNAQGTEDLPLVAGEGFSVIFECESKVPTDQLLLTFDLLNQKREICVWDVIRGSSLGSPVAGRFDLVVKVPPMPLSGGAYVIDFAARLENSYQTLAKHKGAAQIVLEAQRRERGMLSVPLEWTASSPDELRISG